MYLFSKKKDTPLFVDVNMSTEKVPYELTHSPIRSPPRSPNNNHVINSKKQSTYFTFER